MRIHDISTLIHPDMIVYKNKEDKKPVITVVSDYNKGTSYESRALLDMHVGTHMDAPLHMIEGGETIDNQDLYKCVTDCKVFDLSHVEEKIEMKDIDKYSISENDFIIFKTRNSFLKEFDFKFVFISIEVSQFLAKKKIKGIGIDALSVERDQPSHETHEAFLKDGIAVLEGLNLKDINEGEYFLVALPLKIKGAEGAPSRAILIER
ncbi:cyclase family protein [Candidatus Arthromitus sp. SFB-rat-Yit]|uniref:cyclase family protein n=1 Tax=Candidatus Arthromitus sp. SFB-rat-Yit TaxID=1041504 RepID=UPI000227A375|nr:cyclase family protein [Candidatus Arthromitus sp. SFB-rat-Yit]BAK80874.1 polyketide cyclase [Candidatus Arthromitus sp. SFB-rat-Yit]